MGSSIKSILESAADVNVANLAILVVGAIAALAIWLASLVIKYRGERK